MGFRLAPRVVYGFERVSEVIAAALCTTLLVGLVVKDEQRFPIREQLDTIEAQFAASWSAEPVAAPGRHFSRR